MSAQNQSLIMQPDSPPQVDEGGRTLSFAGPEADANFYQPSPQYLGTQSARLEPAVPSQKSSASADEQLTIMHESWSQHLPANQDLRNNMDAKGIISKDNPRLMAIYNTRLLRLIDASSPKAVRQQQITYKSNVSLVSAHFESDYLVTIAESHTANHLLQTVNSTEIELRRVQGEKSEVPDFIQVSLRSRVKRVRVVKTSDRRIYLLIIHQLENYVELREVVPHSGRVDSYIQFILAHQDHSTHQLLDLEDVHILDWPGQGVWACFNFAQREVKMILFEELLLQTHLPVDNLYFDASRCSKLYNQPLYTTPDEGRAFTTETRLVSIDIYRQKGTDKLVFTRESGNQEFISHMIQVLNPYEGTLDSIVIKPIDVQVATSIYPRRILDVCSSPSVGFFVLVQEGLNVYVQMLHHDQLSVKNQIQVNYQEPIKNEKVAKELLGASIIPRSLDLPSEKDVSLSFTYLSCFGTQLGEMELDFGHLATIKHNTNLGMQQVLEAQKEAFKPSIISNDGLQIFRQLVSNSQFKKLAEIVGMRTQERVWICQLGGLKTVLEEALRQQLTQNIPSFLSILKYLSLVYSITDRNQNGVDINNRRAQLIRDINYQLKRIDGIHSVYRAVLKQQIEQTLENQISAQRSQRKFNQSSTAEIASNLRRIICERVEKQANLIRLLLFFAQSDFLCYVNQRRDGLIVPKQGRPLCLEGLSDLTQKVFKDQQFPIVDLKDFVIVFDSEVLPRKTLQLVYYQVLDVSLSPSFRHVDALFKQICGQIFPDIDQQAISALWHVDNLASLKHQIPLHHFLEKIIRHREQLGHLDHLFMRKFELEDQGLPREFLLLGGCRERQQLSNIEVLREIMNHLAPPRSRSYFGSKDYSGFIRYLKENEGQIPKEIYQMIFRDYVDRVIIEDLVQKNLWEQALSPRQMQILEEHLQAKHPELLVCHKIWRREISSGLGRAMSIGQGFGGAVKSESKQLANSYLATLTIGQQKQAYAESKMNKDRQMQYFTDLKDSIHLSGSKYRPGHLDFKLNTDFLFNPSSESPARQQEDEAMRPEEKPQKPSKSTLSSLFFQNEKAQPTLQSHTILQLTCPLTQDLQMALTYDESKRDPRDDSHHLLNSLFEIAPYIVSYAFQGGALSEDSLEEDENMDVNDQPIEERKLQFVTDHMTSAQFEGRQGGDQYLLDASAEFGCQNPLGMYPRDVSQEDDEQLLQNLSDQQVHDFDYNQSNSQGEPVREHTDEDFLQPQLDEPYRLQNLNQTNLKGALEKIFERSLEDSQSMHTTTPGPQGILNHSQTYPVNLNQSTLSAKGLPRTNSTEVAPRFMMSEPHRHSQEGSLITQEIQAENAAEVNPPNMSPKNQQESSAYEKSSIDSASVGDRE